MFMAHFAIVSPKVNSVNVFDMFAQTRSFQHFRAMRALRPAMSVAFCNRRRHHVTIIQRPSSSSSRVVAVLVEFELS